jgi:hypothetical protein
MSTRRRKRRRRCKRRLRILSVSGLGVAFTFSAIEGVEGRVTSLPVLSDSAAQQRLAKR